MTIKHIVTTTEAAYCYLIINSVSNAHLDLFGVSTLGLFVGWSKLPVMVLNILCSLRYEINIQAEAFASNPTFSTRLFYVFNVLNLICT